jgi:S1-C subfamily serine protease
VPLRVAVLSGTLAGREFTFDGPRVSVGRHPESALRFDATGDPDVSTRHAEFRLVDGAWQVRDVGSTNGTWLNGAAITGDAALGDGDVLTFGRSEPRVRVTTGRPSRAMPAPGGGSTQERVAVAVRAETAGLRRTALIAVAVLVAGAGAIVWLLGRENRALASANVALMARQDSIVRQLSAIGAAQAQAAGLDSAYRALQGQARDLQARLARGDATAQGDLARIERTSRRMADVASVDWVAVRRASGAAVALIYVEESDGKAYTGTAFGVTAGGLLVTNRHVVTGNDGRAPSRIGIQFAGTDAVLPARLVRAAQDADLALVQIAVAGTYPTVAGVAGAAAVEVGSPVAVIGFPYGIDTPQERGGGAFRATTSLSTGTVSKTLADNTQIDAFAGQGSSGSPVFDRNGHVVGVVFGGLDESKGRIVYAVPAERLRAVLPPEALARP